MSFLYIVIVLYHSVIVLFCDYIVIFSFVCLYHCTSVALDGNTIMLLWNNNCIRLYKYNVSDHHNITISFYECIVLSLVIL